MAIPGKVLITGANRGIGLALVTVFLERGWHVFGCARQPQKCGAFKKLTSKYRSLFTVIKLDVTNERSIAQAAVSVSRKTKHLDILINNAGVCFKEKAIYRFDSVHAARAFAVNATGPMLMTKHFLRLIKKSLSPKIVNISSLSGSISRVSGFSGFYTYKASKAALNMFSRLLAYELRDFGITTLILHPGLVKTRMNSGAKMLPLESASKIFNIINDNELQDTGSFLSTDLNTCPW